MVKDRKDCEEILVNAASSDPGPIYWPGPGTSQCDDDLPLNGSKVCPTHTPLVRTTKASPHLRLPFFLSNLGSIMIKSEMERGGSVWCYL